MTISPIAHKAIKTTVQKAKELRRVIKPMMTLTTDSTPSFSQQNNVCRKRQAMQGLRKTMGPALLTMVLALVACGGSGEPTTPSLKSVALLAGTTDEGGRGDRLGERTAARFSAPQGLAADGQGGLLVVETNNQKIKRISASGEVSVLLDMARLPTSIDASGRQTRYADPAQVAAGHDGSVYVAAQQMAWTDSVGSGADQGVQTPESWVVLRVGADGTTTVFANPLKQSGPPLDPGKVAGGLVIDRRGELWLADRTRCAIRRIDGNGHISTAVESFTRPDGSPCRGFDDFNYGVTWLALDDQDNLAYGLTNGEVRRRSADGTEPARALGRVAPNYLGGATFEAEGRLLVTDPNGHRLLALLPDGTQTVLAGSAQKSDSIDGPFAEARFDSPVGMARDTLGNTYVTDAGAHTIRRLSRDGQVSTWAGRAPQAGFADGPAASARFGQYGLAVTEAAGSVLVADSGNAVLRRIAGGVVSTWAGVVGERGTADGGPGVARLEYPSAITASADGTVYVGDYQRLRRITPQGQVSTVALVPGPEGVLALQTGARGSLYAATGGSAYGFDSGFSFFTIRRMNPDGQWQTLFPTNDPRQPVIAAACEASLLPAGLAVDAHDAVYFTLGNAVLKLPTDGPPSVFAGDLKAAGADDGIGAAARFSSPTGLTFDTAGNLYVADSANHTVRRIGQDGTVSTVLGRAGQAGIVLGAAPAGLDTPYRVAWTADGLLVVSKQAVLIATTK
ncbi:MAG: hypothetical protein IPN06_00190 [Burkholderiales bacterium]|nr:hypothetical protein [Burkholderiales bacterium]